MNCVDRTALRSHYVLLVLGVPAKAQRTITALISRSQYFAITREDNERIRPAHLPAQSVEGSCPVVLATIVLEKPKSCKRGVGRGLGGPKVGLDQRLNILRVSDSPVLGNHKLTFNV